MEQREKFSLDDERGAGTVGPALATGTAIDDGRLRLLIQREMDGADGAAA